MNGDFVASKNSTPNTGNSKPLDAQLLDEGLQSGSVGKATRVTAVGLYNKFHRFIQVFLMETTVIS